MEWVSESFREGTRLDEERKVDVLTNFFFANVVADDIKGFTPK